MSDLVTDQNNADEASGALAAEFVLGTLEYAERVHASELVDRDPQFRGMVRVWERRFGELHLMVEPVDPPPAIWDRIKPKLESIAPVEAVSDPEAAEVTELAPDTTPDTTPNTTASTIATLEALEAELREEGLAPPASPPPTEPPAPETESPPLVVSEPEAEPVREPVPAPEQPAAAVASSARGWQLFATLMTLVAMVLAGLIAAWRFIPERLPPQLRAVQVLNIHIPEPPRPPPRPPAPPETQFDE